MSVVCQGQGKHFRVCDEKTHDEISFATIRLDDRGHGLIADLHGVFTLDSTAMKSFDRVEVSCLGYESKSFNPASASEIIYLLPADHTINEFVFVPDNEKIRRILRHAEANKNRNNPDKQDAYQCYIYYKTIVDASTGDSATRFKDTAARKLNDFLQNQHLMLSETYSKRTWKRPGEIQEDVLYNRLSGFSKTTFTSLVTDVLPFHAYSDYLVINGKDYRNPVSKGSEKYYRFNLSNEIITGQDTIWALSFFPYGHNANELQGRVYIHSGSFAITNFAGDATDTVLHLTTRIEQQYQSIKSVQGEVWFPHHLNYSIRWRQTLNGRSVRFDMKGNTDIDSVNFMIDPAFRFDKGHSVRIAASAGESGDGLRAVRANPLDEKELRSYRILDSIGRVAHLDKKMEFFSKSLDWKIPLGLVDVNLSQLFTYNDAEGVRLGLGLQTGDKVSRAFSIGGYGAYGFSDQRKMYGMFGAIYFDRYKEFYFHGGYSDDVHDPGRVSLFPDIDKTYLNSYLLWRVDHVQTYKALLSKKTGFWTVQLSALHEHVQPAYAYNLYDNGHYYRSFNDVRGELGMRYAFGETTAPFFNSYYRMGSKYPVCYAKVTRGQIDSGVLHIPYTQAVGAVVWNKHINRFGLEHFNVSGGISQSNTPLPLSKLFAANGYNYVTTGYDPSIYTFGGMMTITPYACYSDRFVSVNWRHDFDWKLFKLESAKYVCSSVPHLCLQYDLLLGGLQHREAQQDVNFIVPNAAYQEVGALLKNVLRIRYMGLYYVTFDYGVFMHLTDHINTTADTRMVFGAGLDI